MIIPGGTPLVSPPGTPTCVTTYAGRPPTMTDGDAVMIGSPSTASVHGTIPGPTCGQPTIGIVTRSGTQIGNPPPIWTVVTDGRSVICPPWMHMICAFDVRICGSEALLCPGCYEFLSKIENLS